MLASTSALVDKRNKVVRPSALSDALTLSKKNLIELELGARAHQGGVLERGRLRARKWTSTELSLPFRASPPPPCSLPVCAIPSLPLELLPCRIKASFRRITETDSGTTQAGGSEFQVTLPPLPHSNLAPEDTMIQHFPPRPVTTSGSSASPALPTPASHWQGPASAVGEDVSGSVECLEAAQVASEIALMSSNVTTALERLQAQEYRRIRDARAVLEADVTKLQLEVEAEVDRSIAMKYLLVPFGILYHN